MNQKTILVTEQLCWEKGLGSLCMQLTCRSLLDIDLPTEANECTCFIVCMSVL